jgi:hypothetical protein
LVDVGSWIFGALTAVNLVVISALITVGPVDAAIRLSTAALAVVSQLTLLPRSHFFDPNNRARKLFA